MNKYVDIDFAKLDIDRIKRKGTPEVVFCESKTPEQLIKIFQTLKQNKQNILATRLKKEQFEQIKEEIKDFNYDEETRILTFVQNEIQKTGLVAICCAGTGDIRVAKEAQMTAEFFGSNTKTFFDIGIAGLHRLLDKIEEIKKANVIVAAAGMDGALAGVIAGLVDIPVIALPTSVGYGVSMGGICALFTMLNSCSEGVMVVNIDNGFNAGYSASLINKKITGAKNG